MCDILILSPKNGFAGLLTEVQCQSKRLRKGGKGRGQEEKEEEKEQQQGSSRRVSSSSRLPAQVTAVGPVS